MSNDNNSVSSDFREAVMACGVEDDALIEALSASNTFRCAVGVNGFDAVVQDVQAEYERCGDSDKAVNKHAIRMGAMIS